MNLEVQQNKGAEVLRAGKVFSMCVLMRIY
jgi:hypothetical protein